MYVWGIKIKQALNCVFLVRIEYQGVLCQGIYFHSIGKFLSLMKFFEEFKN